MQLHELEPSVDFCRRLWHRLDALLLDFEPFEPLGCVEQTRQCSFLSTLCGAAVSSSTRQARAAQASRLEARTCREREVVVEHAHRFVKALTELARELDVLIVQLSRVRRARQCLK